MKCCNNSNIMKYNDKMFCHNCYKLYETPIAKKRVIDNSRLKYLRKNFNHLDNNIILFLDESLKKYRYIKILKRYQILYILIHYINFILKKQILNIEN